MKLAGADDLSRFKRRSIFGIKVLQVTHSIFVKFRRFHSGMIDYYTELLRDACPTFHDRKLLLYTANFASFARAHATNNQRFRNATDTQMLAEKLGLTRYLPSSRINPADASMAIMAASYAVENFYAPKTLEDKVFQHSPFTKPQRGLFPFTSTVINGIRAIRITEEPVGVVLGKDVMSIFNSSLQPNLYYYHLLLVTFDWICSTSICRTGELAPELSKPDAASKIITLDQVKIGNKWLKSIPLHRRAFFLKRMYRNAGSGSLKSFSWWLIKTKKDKSVKRKIMVTCTAGTRKHPILQYFIKTLIARHRASDNLADSAPMFAVPLQNKSLKPRFVHLSYSDISSADKIMTKALIKTDIPFRSHLRRRGGASDLFDAGVPITDIKVIGHWSMGVLDAYLSWSPALIAELQLKGILRAEKRSENNWPSRIMMSLSYPSCVLTFFSHSQTRL